MHVIITAGPTREYLDPVRFLSNPSTGKMGFAVARAAAERGHDVTLIAGPVALKTPKGVMRIDVTSARDMLKASEACVRRRVGGDPRAPRDPCPSVGGDPRAPRDEVFFISTAAVADWRPATCAAKKLKKSQMSGTLRLVRNPDILKTIRKLRSSMPKTLRHLHLVGFAAETNDILSEAERKCREKGLAFIVANDVTERGAGFGTDTNRATFVFPDGTTRPLPLMSKRALAGRIVRTCEGLAKTDEPI